MEQEIYVKEIPNICDECPFHNNIIDKCVLLPKYTTTPFLQSCPLKSLHDHDKELVEKVLEKVSIELENETGIYCEIRQCNSPHYQGDYVWFNYVKFRKLAEKLQKEYEK